MFLKCYNKYEDIGYDAALEKCRNFRHGTIKFGNDILKIGELLELGLVCIPDISQKRTTMMMKTTMTMMMTNRLGGISSFNNLFKIHEFIFAQTSVVSP